MQAVDGHLLSAFGAGKAAFVMPFSNQSRQILKRWRVWAGIRRFHGPDNVHETHTGNPGPEATVAGFNIHATIIRHGKHYKTTGTSRHISLHHTQCAR
jgi:hypothetical protein